MTNFYKRANRIVESCKTTEFQRSCTLRCRELDIARLIVPKPSCKSEGGRGVTPLARHNDRLLLWDCVVCRFIDIEVRHHQFRRSVRQPF
jgi:hypothetical protein